MKYKVLSYCETSKEWVEVREFDTLELANSFAKIYNLTAGSDTMVEVDDGGKH